MSLLLALLIFTAPINGDKKETEVLSVDSSDGTSTPVNQSESSETPPVPTSKTTLPEHSKSGDKSKLVSPVETKEPGKNSLNKDQKTHHKKKQKRTIVKNESVENSEKGMFPWLHGKKFGVGVEIRGNIIPRFFLGLFLKASHDIISPSYSLRFLIRSKKVDVIIKGSYWNVDPKDGVYLGGNYGWSLADYVEFRKFKFYWAQLSLLWKKRVVERLYLTYGAGVGVGYLDTDLNTTPVQGCNPSNYNNVTSSTTYLGSNYCYRDNYKEFWSSQSVPKGMAILEGTIGLRYDINKNFTVKAETGLLFPGFLHTTFAIEYIF